MRTYNYSFLREGGFSSNILSLFISIEKMKGIELINMEMYPEVFDKIQKIAGFQSVKYSNIINEIYISDTKLDSLLYNGLTSTNYNDNLLLGYNNVLDDVYDNSERNQFNTYNIRDYHHMLYSFTEADTSGSYKKEDNMLLEILEDSSKRVIFNTVSSDNTSKAMEQLIEAYKVARDDDSIPKLLLIPCVILDFLLIYPFNEGNEGLSRLLSLLLLYKNDYNIGKYVSFEKQISKHISEYYESIRLSSINWDENKNDYNPFIENFLVSLQLCYIELNSRFKMVNGEKKSKKFRIEETIMKSFEPISRKEIHKVWPDISHETIKKVIKNLLNENKIKKIGNYKDARYKRNWYGKTTQNDENMVIF